MININGSYVSFKRSQTEQNITHLYAVTKKHIKIIIDTESQKKNLIQHYPKLAYIY